MRNPERVLSSLAEHSKASNYQFERLYRILFNEEMFYIAYQRISANKGGMTAGVDGTTTDAMSLPRIEKLIDSLKDESYQPQPARRVYIPKKNGKKRPLGIPSANDKLVQEVVRMILEAIYEGQFEYTSHGFRPNRSCHTALAQIQKTFCGAKWFVEGDIKGFFDNINHTKLIRQIWALGIRDKKLLCIIKEMLKASVILPNGDKTFPIKGTPQGGILSPLLANIVLNELDWWITSQWEEMPTKTDFTTRSNKQGTVIKSHAYRALRRSRLKEVHAVRYADDFKIFCPTHAEAVRAYKATEMWLKDRLGLDISPDKSKVVNLKRQYSDFLGFKLKVRKKGKKYVVRSHMCDKAYKKAHEKLTKEVKTLAHSPDDTAQFIQLQKYNSVVAGLHEYYCIATETTADFGKLAFSINKQLRNRLKGDVSRKGSLKNGFIKDKYGKSRQLRFLHERPIVPVGAVPQKNAQNKRKNINKYTVKGRELIHKNLTINTDAMLWLMRNPVKGRSIEYADNRISLFAAQYGKCAVTGLPMEVHDIHCHHKMPLSKGGTDAYENLILVSKAIHVIIHASSEITIREYLNPLQLDDSKLAKLNKLRTMAEMPVIIL